MTKRIQKFIKEQCDLEEYDEDILEYGLQQIKVYIIAIIVALGLSVAMNVGKNVITFFGVFIPLRLYSGGYHADTQKRCNVVSIGVIILVYWLLNNCSWYDNKWIMLEIIFSILIFILAPVDNKNRRLTKEEKYRFRGKVRKIIIFTNVLFIFLFFISSQYIGGIVMAYMIVCITLILGKIKNNKEAEKYFEQTINN